MIVLVTEIPALVEDNLIQAALNMGEPFVAGMFLFKVIEIFKRAGIKPADNRGSVRCRGIELDTSPMPGRVVDRILQKLRKLGRLTCERGWWSVCRGKV